MNRIAEGHFVSPQDLMKELKIFHSTKKIERADPSSEPPARMKKIANEIFLEMNYRVANTISHCLAQLAQASAHSLHGACVAS